jgi:hypothetical protein
MAYKRRDVVEAQPIREHVEARWEKLANLFPGGSAIGEDPLPVPPWPGKLAALRAGESVSVTLTDVRGFDVPEGRHWMLHADGTLDAYEPSPR